MTTPPPDAREPASRFAAPDLGALPADIAERLLAVQEKSGFVPNVFLLLARRPDEFRAFLATIDKQVPEHLEIHVVCDNYGTHKSPTITRWLARHPRFHLHFTPTSSSWLNQVERWFAYLTDDLLRRDDHRSVQPLESDIRNWATAWNENPKPLIWTKTAEQHH